MAVFKELDEDILFVIFRTCDVYTVLTAARINKLIRALALSKAVWVALVADLIARCIMDAFSDPDFRNYSAAQLRGVVERLVCGPAWAEERPARVVRRQVSVDTSDIFSKISPRWSTYVKLLPGGRFLTLENYDGRLECWSLTRGLCVWTYSQKRRTNYTVEMFDDGNTARFLLPGSLKASFSIVQVDLTTGHSYELFRMPQKDEIRWWTDGDAVLSGNFVVLTLHVHGNRTLLLINWKEGRYLSFHQTLTAPGMAVVPGHIVLATATLEPPHRPVLLAYTHASLASYWRPLADWAPTAPSDAFDLHRIQQCSGIRPAFVMHPGAHEGWQVASEGTRPVSQGMRLALRPSPLQRGSYALSFVVYEKDGLQLVQSSAVPTVPVCKAGDVSYARYSIVKPGSIEDVDLDRQEAGKTELEVIRGESIHLSPSSGAVTTLTGPLVSVSYFV
ncbi:hypothetical protein DFH08DRAFT_1075572 [Mycena albidolilacea]|uniref:F-box domain-containing protein n=1 Tax=Mycena albidolilacea TaxID=1033008 RepID=A0AAD7EY77_9AGAR|nr:hypothetical protein DFH08DRAFT_1075572 [Mycena albidolilacea]